LILVQTAQTIEQSGLAGTVRANQSTDLIATESKATMPPNRTVISLTLSNADADWFDKSVLQD
jgi:hypothetical protein